MADKPKAIVFLDRDGTLNHDPGYISNPDDLHLIDGAATAVRLLQEHYAIVLVSNQSGISRGFFTHEQVQSVMSRLEELLAEGGARLSAIHYCPHQREDACECRKPEPGMLRKAAAEIGLPLENSWMVGDRASDIAAGAAVGARTIMLPEPHDAPPLIVEPDFRCNSMLEAAKIILEKDRLSSPV